MALTFQDRVDLARGCLLGGAIGDSLGAAVEFMSWPQIQAKYGEYGILEFDEAYGGVGLITDDTQMTLFTAEGLIRAYLRLKTKGICHPPSVVGYAYIRWLLTQNAHPTERSIEENARSAPSWLFDRREMHARRAPGNTCLSALVAYDHQPARNTSKGCGTVMRSAPFGFFPEPWSLAAECAALTHGHPEAQISAGMFAQMIANRVRGMTLRKAIDSACRDRRARGSRTQALVRRAIELADRPPTFDVAERIGQIGEGWTADEALAIAVHCALSTNSFYGAITFAVNHNGDSDSTGAICGNLVGTGYPPHAMGAWSRGLELVDAIEKLAEDMILVQAVWKATTKNPVLERGRQALVNQLAQDYPPT